MADRTLEDLERLASPPNPNYLADVVNALRVSLARIEGKLDSALTLRKDFEDYRDEQDKRHMETADRLTKLEANWTWVRWLAGAGWALALVVLAAWFAAHWH